MTTALPWLKDTVKNNASTIALLLVAVAFRIYALGNIPGINGDEAFYGVQALDLLEGRSIDFRTPSGNIINPFYSGPLLMLQSFLPISFWVLRLPSVLTGLVLLPTAFFLTKKLYDRKTAVLLTVLTAVLPVNIAYSRLGWDPSQTTLISIVVLFFALRRQWPALIMALAAALLIHPTNIFLLPIALFPSFGLYMAGNQKSKIKPGYILLGILAMVPGLFFMYSINPELVRSIYKLAPQVFNHFKDLSGWGQFLFDYVRLFSGTTVFQYICGSAYGVAPYTIDLIFLVLFAWLFIKGGMNLLKRKAAAELGLIGGLLFSMASLYLVAGNFIIQPDSERYSLFLIMPTLLVIALLLREISTSAEAEGKILRYVLLLSWALIISFLLQYFVFFFVTGGRSHDTFHTNYPEPKETVLNLIRADAESGSEIVIMASSWWNRMPLQYLARRYDNVTVVNMELTAEDDLPPFTFSQASSVYAVTFRGDNYDVIIQEKLKKRTEYVLSATDFPGKPLLFIYRLSN